MTFEMSVTRSKMGWPEFDGPRADTDRGLVIHFDGRDQQLNRHPKCVAYWRRTRDFHMKTRGWLDIGYSYGVCPHGYTFTGRGYGFEQAAQRHDVGGGRLKEGNTRWTSVTLMSGPSETPTRTQILTVKGLRKYLMTEHGMRGAVKYHGQFSLTDCPGDIIIRLVKSGAFGL